MPWILRDMRPHHSAHEAQLAVVEHVERVEEYLSWKGRINAPSCIRYFGIAAQPSLGAGPKSKPMPRPGAGRPRPSASAAAETVDLTDVEVPIEVEEPSSLFWRPRIRR